MRDFERALKKKIRKEVPDLNSIAPSLSIEVHRKGELLAHMIMGESYRYYDLASLTKILFSATAWMRWVGQSDFDVHLPAYYFLTWWRHRKVTVHDLMTHSAGLSWWQPFYKKMKGSLEPSHRWPQLAAYLRGGRPVKTRKSIYSDLDLFLLGFLLEELKQKSLLEIWEEIRAEIGLENMFFHPHNHLIHAKGDYAPTEQCPWRHRTLQGEVHDENAWALGGVAPHAGLFSTIHDVSKWALALRKALRGSETAAKMFGSMEAAQMFTDRQLKRSKGDWGYLFMKPSIKSSSGLYFSQQSFGHTGFTGTSLWMDPVKDLIVVILSNRVHPTRDNLAFSQLRPLLHDWICELL
jgi:serine-type D-Ala-D-Ala carboxypeptidase